MIIWDRLPSRRRVVGYDEGGTNASEKGRREKAGNQPRNQAAAAAITFVSCAEPIFGLVTAFPARAWSW